MPRPAVALIEGGSHVEDAIRLHLESSGLQVLSTSSDAVDYVLVSSARLFIISSRREDPAEITSVLRLLRRSRPNDPVFVIAWVSSERLAVAALKEGAADYFA